jgi:hypothetical protein
MKYGTCKFDVAKMPRALCHTLATGCALEVAVDGAHAWILEASFFRTLGGLVHYLRKLNFGDRVRFLGRRTTIVSNWIKLRDKGWHTISSGERIPNWTSLILRIGAAEKANWTVDMAGRHGYG